ncbi:MAG: alpha,alpha-phosphotrehalase, partial [Lachnospiraceae bacterium]|nr:alpha,alpha-phosphotrehalase [Lachnospiraceae bacterium]
MKNFKDSVIYQIYTKSFQDSNNDGLGDIRGVVERLDYLHDLGIDYIWMTPFFVSPLNDNGYDVADYKAIDPTFGTMADVELLIKEADKRGIGLMFDMVFNHTSTSHNWFQRALNGEQKYMDYYFFQDGSPECPPTNWQSKFGGNAWEYVPSLKKWYLHLFDKTQADLNWDNPAVREELKSVIRFWKEKGVKGFRFDVVNLISKPSTFENDKTGDGRRFYTDGPHIHEYLQELVTDTGIEDMVTVGEMSSTSLENCIRYSSPAEKELSMVFHFHHLKVDYKDGDKWELQSPDYRKLKDIFRDWQLTLQETGSWEATFWCNHDQPRIVSRLGNDNKYRKESAKMLATCIHMLRGTPYIYQGEELGMTNPYFTDISEYRDVESLNYYDIMRKNGKTDAEAIRILQERSRDNSRTPMQWNASSYAGFSNTKPWISIPENHTYINASAEIADDNSILHYYKKLIQLRKTEHAISEGTIEFLYHDHEDLFIYQRTLKDEKLIVINNLISKETTLDASILKKGYKKLIGNYEGVIQNSEMITLRPYESIVCKS